MSPQFLTALIRGLVGGVVLAGSAFFAQLAAGNSLRAAEIGAGAAFFGGLVIRFGAEGLIDTLNAPPGNAPKP